MERKTALQLLKTEPNEIITDIEDADVVSKLRIMIKDNKPEEFDQLGVVFDDQFLHRFLVANERDFKKTYEYLESYIYYRTTSYPGILRQFPTMQPKMLDSNNVVLLKHRDDQDAMVILTRAKYWNPSENPVDEFIIQATILAELGFRMDEMVPQTGAVFIIDCAELTWWQASYLTPAAIIKGFNLTICSLPVNAKAIHIVNGGMLVTMLYSALYPVAKQWIGDRVHLHYGDLSTLHAQVPKEILPASLGGPLGEHEAAELEIPTMLRGLIATGYGGYNSIGNVASTSS